MANNITYKINDDYIYLCLIGTRNNYETKIYNDDIYFDIINKMVHNISEAYIEFDELENNRCNYVDNIIFKYNDEIITLLSDEFKEFDPKISKLENEIEQMSKYIKQLEKENERLKQLLNKIEKDKC